MRFEFEPRGILKNLSPIKLRSAIDIDPRTQDFFKVVIEQRMLSTSRADLSELERKRLKRALKILANAASYGIYAQMDRKESEEKVKISCQGIDPEPVHL